jgi:hypothetical protein
MQNTPVVFTSMQSTHLVSASNHNVIGGEFTWLYPVPHNLMSLPSLHKMEEIANFTVECLSQKKLPDGQIERRIRLVNSFGEGSGAEPIILDPAVFKTLHKFRVWVLSRGNFCWLGSLRDLHQLRDHLFADATWRQIPVE